MVPSGHDTEAAKQFYDYLYSQYLSNITAPRTYIDWAGPLWIAFFAGLLILFFFGYSLYFQSVRRKDGGELYGVASFADSLLERIGVIGRWQWLLWIGTLAWAFYYIITHALRGQVY